jgi:branched-chain amino acid transport system permease protein
MVKKVVFGLFFLVLLALGAILRNEPYWLHVIIVCIFSSMLAMSWLLILKIGHLSLAHAAFMGIGGVSSALLVKEAGLSFWLALPLAGLIAATIAVVLGFPILRVKGIYFLIVTFAFNELVGIIIRNWKFLGGYVGLIDVPRPNHIGGIDFSSKVHYYYLILFLAVVTVIVLYRVYSSRIGRIFTSIGEDEDLAQSVGINVLKYKLLAFAIGCFFAGLTGSFVVHYLNFSGAEMYSTLQSLNIQIYAIVGGMGFTIGGPIVGAFFLTLLVEFLDIPIKAQTLVYASILILVIFYLRGGLITLPQRVLEGIARLSKLRTRGTSHGTT